MSGRVVRRWLFALHDGLKSKPTLAWLRTLERSQWLDRAALEARQADGLRQLVTHAWDTVPFYRRRMEERGLAPRDVQENLARLPYLTRDDLRAHSDELRSRRPPRRVQRISTGGSTGSPVTVLVTMEQHGFGEAARLRAQRWFGVEPGAREIVLWGSSIELGRQTRWREIRDRLLCSRLLSAFDLSEPALARYAETLHAFKPQKLYGYATALALLAAYLRKAGRRPGPGWPRAVFATAEPLFDFQREIITEVFGCPVAVEYGARDAGLIAHECPAGQLHINAEGIIVEIAGDGAAGEPGMGEIVVTNLLSRAMPLLRYRTGDMGSLAAEPCSCGRGLPALSRVEGRHTDFLVTPDGRVMHALAAIYILREVPSIQAFQVVQERIDRVTVSVVVGEGFDEATGAAVVSRFRALLGPRMAVELALVPEIHRPASGKHRYVISNVAAEYLRAELALR